MPNLDGHFERPDLTTYAPRRLADRVRHFTEDEATVLPT